MSPKRKRRDDRHASDDSEDDSSTDSQPKRKRRKSEKKHKKKTKKAKKHKSRGDRKGASGANYGPPVGTIPSQRLDPKNDYFLYHKKLCMYLDTQGLVFDQLSGSETRSHFAEFCSRYNKGELAAVFYEDATETSTSTTRHSWSFQTSVVENERLRDIQQKVAAAGRDSSTAQRCVVVPPPTNPRRTMDRTTSTTKPATAPPQKPHRSRRLDYETVAEEYGLTSTRDMPAAQVRRREAAARTRPNHSNNDTLLSDDALYGSGDAVSFATAVARQHERKQARQEQQQARIATLQEQERIKQQKMMEALGLGDRAGEKIRIAPRNDG